MARVKGVPPNTPRLKMRGHLSVFAHPLSKGLVARVPQTIQPVRSAKRQAAINDFVAAVKLIKQATPDEVDAAYKNAVGTPFLPRDLLMAAAYGKMVRVVTTDGQVWRGIRLMQTEIQTMLDSISATPGVILVRTDDGWAALLPGSNNQVLTLDGATGLPDWKDSQGGGGGGGGGAATEFYVPQFDAHDGTTFNSSFWGGRAILMREDATINSVKFWTPAAVATAKLTPAIYGVTGTADVGALIASGPQITGITAGLNKLPLSAPLAVSKGELLYVGFQVLTTSIKLGTGAVSGTAYFSSTGALPDPAPTATYTEQAWSTMWASSDA